MNVTIQNTKPLAAQIKKTLHFPNITKGVYQGSRRITKGLNGKAIVFFPSRKNKSMMPCESRLESDNCLFLELDNDVSNYQTQPFTLRIKTNQTYTPDSAYIDPLGTIVVQEVKFSGALEKRSCREKYNKIKRILVSEGIKFEIRTEKELQVSPMIENYKFLYRNSHHDFSKYEIEIAIDILSRFNPPVSLSQARNECALSELHPLIADYLLYRGIAKYNPKEKLTSSSLIWIKGGIHNV